MGNEKWISLAKDVAVSLARLHHVAISSSQVQHADYWVRNVYIYFQSLPIKIELENGNVETFYFNDAAYFLDVHNSNRIMKPQIIFYNHLMCIWAFLYLSKMSFSH